MVNVAENNVPCAACNYPIPEFTYIGQQKKCPYCGTINEAIAQVTIPTPVFVGFVCFGLGVLFGPALLATTAGGQSWMQRQIRERIK
jgi:phage FluMu protein Com